MATQHIREAVRTWLESREDQETRAMRVQALEWIEDLDGKIERLRAENRGLKDLAIDDWPIDGVTVSCLPGRHGGYEQGSQCFAGDSTWWWFPTREAAEAALSLAVEESRVAITDEAERKGE